MSAATSKFVAKKVRRVRWRPRTDSMQVNADMFATGSWDDESNEVSLWRCKAEDGGDATNINLLASVPVQGDVSGLNWINPDLLVCSSSKGRLNLYRMEQYRILVLGQEWVDLHGTGGSTCLAVHGESVASAGQDGRLNILNIRQRNPVKVYEKADSCSITDVLFSRASDLLLANMRGQLKLFDLRSNLQDPASTFLLSNDQVAVTCLAKHPSQGHIVLSGGENGYLAGWDLRQGKHPVTLLSAHQSPVSEIKFHPDQPDHIFTASQGGEVWHWNGQSLKNSSMNPALENLNTTSPWLSSQAVRHKVETNSLVSKQPLPINSVDVLGQAVLFGGDNEAFYILHNVLL